jgi:alpha-L-fucosidase
MKMTKATKRPCSVKFSHFILSIFLLAAFLALPSTYSFSQTPEEERYVPETDPLVRQKLEAWQDLKFGLLMH